MRLDADFTSESQSFTVQTSDAAQTLDVELSNPEAAFSVQADGGVQEFTASLTEGDQSMEADMGEIQIVSGGDGEPGKDGVSPIVTLTDTGDGVDISVTDAEGTKAATVRHGKDGQDGKDGEPGYTPVKGVDYFDGAPGSPGEKGDPGYTPVKGVDYFDGEPGAPGISPIVSVQDIDGGHRVTITDKDGDKVFDVMDGKDGQDGSGGGTAVQSDWGENDESSPAYVLNRPFYKYTTEGSRLDFIDGTYTSESQPELGGAFAVFVDTAYKENLTMSREYAVIYNGVEYAGLAGNLGVLSGFTCYGNFSMVNALLGTDYEDTGEPFVIAAANAGTFLVSDLTQQTTDAWEMYAPPIYTERIVKIPAEYMPFGGVGTGLGAEIFNSISNVASGQQSHAEGSNTTASGQQSHAEGSNTTASGKYSHAEGYFAKASSDSAHAEGHGTTASGQCSHAEGYFTIARGIGSHAQGRYNIEDEDNKYAHIVGNGYSDSTRSNAHTLDWNGVAWYQSRPQFGGIAQDDGSQTVMANGDTEIVLMSPSGKLFGITVSDDGVLTATAK